MHVSWFVHTFILHTHTHTHNSRLTLTIIQAIFIVGTMPSS